VFTWGSVVWCINAFFVWLPLQDPSTEFDGEIANGGGISAFIGATIFEFGSVLLMIEAVNENRAECFGWAFEEALGERGIIRVKPGHCIHHQGNKHNFVKTSNEVLGKIISLFVINFIWNSSQCHALLTKSKIPAESILAVS